MRSDTQKEHKMVDGKNAEKTLVSPIGRRGERYRKLVAQSTDSKTLEQVWNKFERWAEKKYPLGNHPDYWFQVFFAQKGRLLEKSRVVTEGFIRRVVRENPRYISWLLKRDGFSVKHQAFLEEIFSDFIREIEHSEAILEDGVPWWSEIASKSYLFESDRQERLAENVVSRLLEIYEKARRSRTPEADYHTWINRLLILTSHLKKINEEQLEQLLHERRKTHLSLEHFEPLITHPAAGEKVWRELLHSWEEWFEPGFEYDEPETLAQIPQARIHPDIRPRLVEIALETRSMLLLGDLMRDARGEELKTLVRAFMEKSKGRCLALLTSGVAEGIEDLSEEDIAPLLSSGDKENRVMALTLLGEVGRPASQERVEAQKDKNENWRRNLHVGLPF